MPKFKYEPNKNKTNNLSVNQKDEKEETTPNLTQNTRPSFNSNLTQVKSYPAPQTQQTQPENPLSATSTKIDKTDNVEIKDKTDIPATTSFSSESTSQEIQTEKDIVEPKEKFKPNKKIILCSSLVLAAICLLLCVFKLSNKTVYTIDSQDLIATSVTDVEDGALIDIKNSVPLNLPIKDFNISIDEETNKDKVETLLWDFTDTNKNKISIYINGENYKTVTLSKKPIKIDVPVGAKVEIIQTETVNSPYTPYALKVNGTTYFNRTSADKSNNYQFIIMKETKDLTLDDFNTPEETDTTEEETE